MELRSFLDHHKISYCESENVARLSYVGIGGSVTLATYPKNRGELLCLLSYVFSHGIPHKIVGNMSNILPPDGNWGVCLVSTAKMRSVCLENGLAVAECGTPLPLLCRSMVEMGLMPPVALSGIPATVGGAVYQNAGAYGLSTGDCLAFADVYDPRADRVIRLEREALAFSYRCSSLAAHGILLSAAFAGCEGDIGVAQASMQKLAQKRRESQPSERSLGSVFLRVGETSAAYYIDKSGLKGYRIGDAMVSEKHAGFIVNIGNATAKDYRALIAFIKQTVFERFGVLLVTEIEIIEEKEKNAWLRFV